MNQVLDRIVCYEEKDQNILEWHLQGLWNKPDYKDCQSLNHVWQKIIDKYGGIELLALLKALKEV